MKIYIFRCRARTQLQAASRYETGSNLPIDRCPGGWEFVKSVELTETSRPRVGVDLKQLRVRMHDDGWHVWEAAAELREDAQPAMPPLAGEAPPLASVPAPLAALSVETIPAIAPLLAAAAPPPPPVAVAPPPAPPRPAAAPSPPPRPAASAPPPRAPARSAPRQAASPPAAPRPAAPARAAAAPASRRATAAGAHSRGAHASAPPEETVTPAASSRVSAAPAATAPTRPASATPRPHRVAWFDIPVHDIDRAIRFYSAVFGAGLQKQQAGPGMAMAMLPQTDGTACGCLVQNMDARPSESGLLLYLSAEGRLDLAVSVAQKNGGRVLQTKHSIAPYGFRAILLDTEGNRIALHSTT